MYLKRQNVHEFNKSEKSQAGKIKRGLFISWWRNWRVYLTS